MAARYGSVQQRAMLAEMGIDVWIGRGGAADPGPLAEPPVAKRSAQLPSAAQGHAASALLELNKQILTCTQCGLHASRTQAVCGVGSPTAEIMVVGEAPGADEDQQGEPFVGPAGQLLTAMLRAIGRERDVVFIANVLKCRPPQNRDPSVSESATCLPFLERQIELVGPRLLLVVGGVAAHSLLGVDTPVGRLRGQVHRYGERQVPVVVTYHPAYLLRSPKQKRRAWEDLLFAVDVLEGQPL